MIEALTLANFSNDNEGSCLKWIAIERVKHVPDHLAYDVVFGADTTNRGHPNIVQEGGAHHLRLDVLKRLSRNLDATR